MNELEHVDIPLVAWRSGWRFNAGLNVKNQQRISSDCFVSMDKIGSIAPFYNPEAWNLELKTTVAPETLTGRLFAHGFELQQARSQMSSDLFALMVEPNVLLGQSHNALELVLVSNRNDVKHDENKSWIDNADVPVVMVHSHESALRKFCVVFGETDIHQATLKARNYLNKDVADLWQRELSGRANFWLRQSVDKELKPLLAYAVETLRVALQPREGVFTSSWSAADFPSKGYMDANQLLPLAMAWCHIDPSIAMQLVETVLASIKEDGSLTRSLYSDGSAISYEAPYPLVAQAVEWVWETTRDMDFVARAVPPLARYLNWAIHHYDIDLKGMPCWPSPGEALIEETQDNFLCSADLVSFLLSEIDALFRMAELLPIGAVEFGRLAEERERVADTLETKLWDVDAKNFRDLYIGGEHITRLTLSAVMPLLWSQLPAHFKPPLLGQLTNSNFLFTERGAALWVKWENDPQNPPVPIFHQILVVEGLRRAKAETEHRLYRDALLKTIDTTYQDPMTAALAVILLTKPMVALTENAVVSLSLSWLGRHKRSVLVASCALLILLIAGISYSWSKKTLTIQSAVTMMGLADRYYDEGNYDEAIRVYKEIEGTSSKRYSVEFSLANAYFKKGQYDEAEKYYRIATEKEASNPRAHLNLALTLVRKGQFDEAIVTYQKVIDDFGTYYPDSVEKARAAMELIKQDQKM